MMKCLYLIAALWALSCGSAFAQGGMMPGPGTVHSTGGGGSNVTPDPAGPGTQKYQANSNSFSYTGLTITAGLTNPGLVCWVLRVHASNDVEAGLSLTWGAQPVSLIFTNDGFTPGATKASALFFFGLRNPTSGPQTLTISATNTATDNFINCVSFSNVNQTSDAAAFPNATGAGGGAASIAVTSSVGHIAVGIFNNGSNNGTIIGTTVINDSSSGAIINAAADYVVSSGVSTTVGTTTVQNLISGMDIAN